MDGIEFFNVEMGDELAKEYGYGCDLWCQIKKTLKRSKAKTCDKTCPFGASQSVHPTVK